MDRQVRQARTMQTELRARAEPNGQEMYIEGYFAIFNRQTELWPGAYEEIAPGAFEDTLSNDIRALVNHDPTLVLGRTKAGTLELRTDNYGLWGRITINPNDTDALNIYERVKRGDIDQCSFGFNIIEEETEWREDGTVKWRLKKVDLHEVSICTFPAYEDTSVQARKAEVDQYRKRQLEQKKNQLRERMRRCLSS